VALILQPGNVWVIEKGLPDDPGTVEALRTCHLRGWVELLSDAIPCGRLSPEGKLPDGYPFTDAQPLYRLTSAGWEVIHRTRDWVIATFMVAFGTLAATLIGYLIR
jgi:hypothetical protein